MSERLYRDRHADLENATHGRPSAPGRSTLTSRHVMRKERDANGVAADADAYVARAADSSGTALPDDLRGRFESSLGADLSSVRIHTGDRSQDANDAVGARAYTVGQDIHFGAGQYDPATSSGQFLIAHEVAHTVQQGAGSTKRQHKLEVSTPGDSAEVEADRAAAAMVSGSAASVTSGGGQAQRKVFRDEAPAGSKYTISSLPSQLTVINLDPNAAILPMVMACPYFAGASAAVKAGVSDAVKSWPSPFTSTMSAHRGKIKHADCEWSVELSVQLASATHHGDGGKGTLQSGGNASYGGGTEHSSGHEVKAGAGAGGDSGNASIEATKSDSAASSTTSSHGSSSSASVEAPMQEFGVMLMVTAKISRTVTHDSSYVSPAELTRMSVSNDVMSALNPLTAITDIAMETVGGGIDRFEKTKREMEATPDEGTQSMTLAMPCMGVISVPTSACTKVG